MTDLRNNILQGIDSYKNPLKSGYYSSSRPSSNSWWISRILWYLFTAIIVGILIVWIIYSVGGPEIKDSIKKYVDYISQKIQEVNTMDYTQTLSTSPVAPSDSNTSNNTSSIPTNSSTISSPNTLQYSNIEQETNAINTALNFTPPEVTQSNNTFQNDEPDSSIQGSKTQFYQGLWWYIDGDNGIPNSSTQLPNVYTSAPNTNL